MSTPITRDGLYERGFLSDGAGIYSFPENARTEIWVRLDNHVLIANQYSPEEYNSIEVPNCRTMEQLDQLISLFTAP